MTLNYSSLRLIVYLVMAIIASRSVSSAQSYRFNGHVLVVFNTANSESEALAHYYAKKRHIADDHILGVRAPDKEEITRDEFNDQIRDPIDAYLVNKKWLERQPGHSPFGDQQLPVMAARTNEIYIMVLIYGMPLKVAQDAKVSDATVNNAALATNASSVDSELTLLPYQGLPITGLLPNPYALISYDRPFDGLDAKHMIMVTRLDGPTTDDVRRMIDDSLAAEGSRLSGNVYLDARGITDENQGYYQGDRWLRDSAKMLRKHGFYTELDDKPELFSEKLPWTNIALYAGWYAGDAAGPFMRDARAFAKGAIAYHIHSFSASTLRSATSNWCGPFIAKGAAATMGAVYEPYLDFMPQWDIFVERILNGCNFAEAAYASTKALSWMTVFVGDPLYTPFQMPIEDAAALNPDKPSVHRDLLLIQEARALLVKGDVIAAKEMAEKAIASLNATFVAWEGYGEIMSDPRLEPPNSTVALAYEHAYNLSITVEDQVRTGMKAASSYQDRFRVQDSKRILGMLLSRYPNESVYYGAEALLNKIAGSQTASNATPPSTSLPLNSLPPSINTPAVSPYIPQKAGTN